MHSQSIHRITLGRRCGIVASLIVVAGTSSVVEAASKAAPKVGTVANTAAVSRVTYGGRAAFRLSDGKTEAIIVPQIGRVMAYRFAGGPNVLWNHQSKTFKPDEWKNWGGDKTWPAPQSHWPVMSGKGWPPDPAWDGLPHRAQVLANRRLRMTSPVSKGFGARVVREFYFNQAGEFVVEQAVEKRHGPPLMLSLWSVTQITPPDAIFLPLNPQSIYKNNFHWIAPPKSEVSAKQISPTLLQVRPVTATSFKIGADAPAVGAVAVSNGVAFVQRAPHPAGDYPDGALGHGFPVELWNNADPYYNELELLSPLRPLSGGSRWQYTVRWSLHRLPSTDVNSPAVHSAVDKLLQAPWSGA